MMLRMGEVPPFDPDAADRYLWEVMADHLTARIEMGDLPQGGRLPNERELAAEYGVAVGTARRAVRELAARDLVRVMPGRGVIVRPRS
jgi:DNA-binding GntR family transcriptional regulator